MSLTTSSEITAASAPTDEAAGPARRLSGQADRGRHGLRPDRRDLRVAGARRRVHGLDPRHVPDRRHRQADPQYERDHRAWRALSITIPLAARVFDLSFAYVMTLSGVAERALRRSRHAAGARGRHRPRDRPGDRRDQRGRRRGHEDRLVHRDARNRLADPGADHDGHLRHADQPTPTSPARSRRSDRRASRGSRCRSSTSPPRRCPSGTCSSTRRRAGGCTRPASTPMRRGSRASRSTGCASSRSWRRAGSPAQPASCSRRCSAAARRPAARPTCCPASLPRSSGRRSSRTAASTPAARSSRCCCSAPARPAWRSPPRRSGRGDMFVGVVLIAALAVTGIQRRATVRSRRFWRRGAAPATQ